MLGRPITLIAVVGLFAALTLFAIASQTVAQSAQVGTIKTTKTIPNISSSNVVTVTLTITNNGSIPITDFEIYEYFNSAFTPSRSGTIKQPSGESAFSISVGGLATAVQQIIDPPSPDSLQPGQTMTIQYTEKAPGAGDFQVPAALVWYSFVVGTSTSRTSVYSNGITVHIPTETERVVIGVYPYVLAVTAFAVTLTILFWARRKLSHADDKRLSREKGPAI